MAHLLLDRVLGHEAEDLHLLLLPDAVRAVHGLQVRLTLGEIFRGVNGRCEWEV